MDSLTFIRRIMLTGFVLVVSGAAVLVWIGESRFAWFLFYRGIAAVGVGTVWGFILAILSIRASDFKDR